MAQEQSIEAARARIQRLVEEIAALSKKEMRSEDYFQQFLVRAVQASDARGGAVWLVGQRSATDGKSEFQLAAEVEFDSSLFQSDEQQRSNMLKALQEVVQNRKPLVFAPAHAPVDPGSLQAQLQQLQGGSLPPDANKTPYPFLQVPLFLKEQVLGVLQVWLQPYVTAQNYAEFATFLSSLAAYVEQHFQSRRLGTLVVETQRLQHLLKFTGDVAGSLEPLEVARLASNYGRDLIGCERCSVLTLHGDRWRVLAISGQETVEKKSAMVKAITTFVGAHAEKQIVLLSKKELLARASSPAEANGAETADGAVNGAAAAPPAVRRTDEIDLNYFQISHVLSAEIAPLLDANQELIGAYFAESTTEHFFEGPSGTKEPTTANRVTEWLATHTSRSLKAAQDYHSLPFLRISRRIRDTRLLLTGPRRNRVLFRLGIIAVLLAAVAFYPKMDRVDGDCTLTPMKRSSIVPEVPGRVEKVLVREGDRVAKDAPIAQLETKRLETELEANEQVRRSHVAEGDRARSLGDEAAAQVAFLQARVAEENEKKLRLDLAAATLRSPIDGVVLTKDIELHKGEAIQAGSPFAEVAALDDWELQIEVSEKKIGRLEKEVPKDGTGTPTRVNFILYSQSAQKLHAQLASRDQISASAYPRDTENVFIVTLPNIAIPAEMQPAMRPGLTGRAKIDLGRKPLIWIFWRNIWNWFEMRLIG